MKKLLLILFAGISLQSYAQLDQTLYGFEGIAQSNLLNPAMTPKAKFTLGLPGLSLLSFRVVNSGFTAGDVLAKGTDINQNIPNLIDNLDGDEFISFNAEIPLLYVGFKTKKGYFSLGASNNLFFKYTLPNELFELVYYGNNSSSIPDQLIDFKNFNIELTSYTTYHLGYSHRFLSDKLTVGARFKMYQGQFSTQINSTQLEIEANTDDPWVLRSNSEILYAGTPNLIGDGFEINTDDIDFAEQAISFDNINYGFDFGIDYKINKRLSINAAAIDVGAEIEWKNDISREISQGEFVLDGFGEIIFGENDGNIDSIFNHTLDTLKDVMNYRDTTAVSYTTKLPRRYTVGGVFKLTEKHQFGAQYTNLDNDLQEDLSAFTLSYYGNWSRWFQWRASYTFADKYSNNLGLGMSLKGGPLQFYVMADDVLDFMTGGKDINNVQVRMGINISIYGKKDKKNKVEDDDDYSPLEEVEESDE